MRSLWRQQGNTAAPRQVLEAGAWDTSRPCLDDRHLAIGSPRYRLPGDLVDTVEVLAGLNGRG
jgi:hypothetical protein